jgi:hypothetical protein
MNYVLIATGVLGGGALFMRTQMTPANRSAYDMGLTIGATIGGTAVLSIFWNL